MENEIKEAFFEEKGLSESTIKFYTCAFKDYENFCKESLHTLLNEADDEEETGIRWKKRSLKNRLNSYRQYLYEQRPEGTARAYLNAVKTFYRHFEIELQPLPSFNSKNIKKTYQMTSKDLLTYDELNLAYTSAKNYMQAFILLSSSTGLACIDILNLTISDLFDACEDYLPLTGSIPHKLMDLQGTKDIVPTFYLERQKTRKSFFTFASPEAIHHVCGYLLTKNDLNMDSKLINKNKETIFYNCRVINDVLDLGKVGVHNKFRTHALRKYHASKLLNSGFSIDEVDALQGRSKDKTHRAYFIEDPKVLREKYIANLDNICILSAVNQLDVESPEYMELKEEKNRIQKEYNDLEDKINELSKSQEELMKIFNSTTQ